MIPFGLSSLMTVSMPIARRASKCLPPGAVALYLFNEGSGQILHDYSGNGNHGILGSELGTDTNDPTWTREGATFLTDDYIEVPRFNRLFAAPDNPFTVTIAFSSAGQGGIFSQTIWAAENRRTFCLYSLTDGRIYPIVRGVDSIISNPLNTPTIFTIVWDGTILSAYKNNVKVNINQPGTAEEEAVKFARFGTANNSSDGAWEGGVIYATGFWSRALTNTEVAQAHAYLKGYLAKKGVVLP